MLCCGYTLTDFPISIRLTSLALWQSNDCPSASKATLMNMDKYFMWIHYERLHNHNKAKHNKTVCIFIGIYCMHKCNWLSLVGWLFGTEPLPYWYKTRVGSQNFGHPSWCLICNICIGFKIMFDMDQIIMWWNILVQWFPMTEIWALKYWEGFQLWWLLQKINFQSRDK